MGNLEMNNKATLLLLTMIGFFATSYVVTSIYSTITFLVLGMATTYGSLIFAVGKSMLDVIQEFWGVTVRKNVVIVAMVMRVLFFILTMIGVKFGHYDASTKQFFDGVLRIMFFSEVTVFVGQYIVDPRVYSIFGKLFKGKSPFVRGFISNMVSTIVVSPIYAYGSFWGVKPDNIVHKLAWTKFLLESPVMVISALIGALIIFYMRKSMKMESMVERKGQDLI